jgi:hypothetical protein
MASHKLLSHWISPVLLKASPAEGHSRSILTDPSDVALAVTFEIRFNNQDEAWPVSFNSFRTASCYSDITSTWSHVSCV